MNTNKLQASLQIAVSPGKLNKKDEMQSFYGDAGEGEITLKQLIFQTFCKKINHKQTNNKKKLAAIYGYGSNPFNSIIKCIKKILQLGRSVMKHVYLGIVFIMNSCRA